ncbi:MAG: hypothetical protein O7F73_11125, partial [Gammaproteobacteria bacterium]|nr:hypothetical protein [Gammaproteobacteria bacterium]
MKDDSHVNSSPRSHIYTFTIQNSMSVSAGKPGAQATSSNASAIGEAPSCNARRQAVLDTLFSYVDGWRNTLHALHPDTIVRWHRYGFR